MDRTGQRVGQYELLDRLGAGTEGSVYRAKRDGEEVPRFAIKVFDPSGSVDEAAIRRFARESQVVAGLQHANLARVRDWVPDQDGGCLVMDLVRGVTLESYLQGQGPRPLEEAAAVVAHVAAGLDFLHANNVVHRDLKPSNIVLAGAGEDIATVRMMSPDNWRATLVDYGAAKRIGGTDPSLTELGVGSAPLTLLYASPEQCDQQEATPLSDVYSLGVVAAEMLGGTSPFAPYANANRLLAIRLTAGHQPLCTICPKCDFPPGLQRVLDRALAAAPADRYPSAGEFASELSGVVHVADGGNL